MLPALPGLQSAVCLRCSAAWRSAQRRWPSPHSAAPPAAAARGAPAGPPAGSAAAGDSAGQPPGALCPSPRTVVPTAAALNASQYIL